MLQYTQVVRVFTNPHSIQTSILTTRGHNLEYFILPSNPRRKTAASDGPHGRAK